MLPRTRHTLFASALLTAAISGCATLSGVLGIEPRVADVRVLVLDFDPRLPGYRAPALREELGWKTPRALADTFRAAVREASRGGVVYNVVDWRIIDGFPPLADGSALDLDAYRGCVEEGTDCRTTGAVDYGALLERYGVAAMAAGDFVDEVWVFGGPGMGLRPFVMAGPGAAGHADPPHPDPGLTGVLPVMSFDYAGTATDMLYALCLRAEGALERVHPDAPGQGRSDWDRFTATIAEADTAGVGRCDRPPNATEPFQYDSDRAVPSTAPDWLHYPVRQGLTAPVSAAFWGGDRSGFLRWWLYHLPHTPEATEDGRTGDWWQHIYRPDAFHDDGRPRS